MRKIAKLVRASEKCIAIFTEITKEFISNPNREPRDDPIWVVKLKRPLLPLQDVKTRWDSTTQMLLRIRILRRPLDVFLRRQRKEWLILSSNQWEQVEYLIELTAPFNAMTQHAGVSRAPSIHDAFPIYNNLFDHIEFNQERLAMKTRAWKVQLHDALQDAHAKLSKYYSKTSDDKLNHIYAFALLLHPAKHETAFTEETWGDGDYRTMYIEALREKWSTAYQDRCEAPPPRPASPQKTGGVNLLKVIQNRRREKQPQLGDVEQHSYDELSRYFKFCTYIKCGSSVVVSYV